MLREGPAEQGVLDGPRRVGGLQSRGVDRKEPLQGLDCCPTGGKRGLPGRSFSTATLPSHLSDSDAPEILHPHCLPWCRLAWALLEP